MKNLVLISVLACGFLWGCKPEDLNPGCPKVGSYFTGNVAGTNVCYIDGHSFTVGSGYGEDNNFFIPTIDIGYDYFPNSLKPYGGYFDIQFDFLTREQYNINYIRDTLLAVGIKKILGTDMKGVGNFEILLSPPSIIDTLPEKHYYAGYKGDQTCSELRVTELKQMNDSLLLVTFLINCKLYDYFTDKYVGDLKNGELKAGFVVSKNP
jgi:hypothetical protein